MKRVFIIHGWDGTPKDAWFPWLKNELEKSGFAVQVPQMPEAAAPRIKNWVPKLSELVGMADEGTYFVGHSMGCQTIVRYLETLPDGARVGGAVFVAGFFKHLTGIIKPEEKEIESEWLKTPLDFAKVRLRLTKSVAIFSDNDEWVPLDNQDDFRDKLGSEIVVMHNMQHFGSTSGVKELPIVVQKIRAF